jgi:S-disulfanyl-L-cysteine oxidoreductase SoxD
MRSAGLLLLLLLAACRASETTDNLAQIALGKQVYLANCASCHGINGEGQRPAAPLERDETGRYPAPPHDDTGHTWHHDDDLLINIIRNGGVGDPVNFYDMPAYRGKLTDVEINAVVAYIKTLWTDEQRAYQQEQTDAVRSGR